MGPSPKEKFTVPKPKQKYTVPKPKIKASPRPKFAPRKPTGKFTSLPRKNGTPVDIEAQTDKPQVIVIKKKGSCSKCCICLWVFLTIFIIGVAVILITFRKEIFGKSKVKIK